MRRRWFQFSALLVLLLLVLAVKGQTKPAATAPDEFVGQQQERSQRNPAMLTFTARFADGKKKFQQGEIIRIELAFSSSKPNAYSIDSAGYDRSGRLDIDQFVLDVGEGVSDPLANYFQAQEFFMMGGLRGNPALTEKPYVITAELNEWKRFDRPGKYRLYVISGRTMKGTDFNWDQKFGVTSNLLEFEILRADPKWAEQTLKEAVTIIDGPSDENKLNDACRVVRFLNTERAAREMIRRYEEPEAKCANEFHFGLFGSTHHEVIGREIDRKIDSTSFPVSTGFIWAAAFNAWLLTDPPALPPYPSDDEAKQASWQLLRDQRKATLKTFVDKYIDRLAIAVPRKKGPALAVSLATIFDSRGDGQANADLLAKLVAVFLDLPADRQAFFLEYRWAGLPGPAMASVLRKLIENPPHSEWKDLRSLALKRLYEIAPAEGRQLILKELGSADPRVDLETLSLLPDTELPALEQAWADRVSTKGNKYSDTRLQAALIERYGSKAIYPRLRAEIAERIGHIPCEDQTSLLRYFQRVDEAFGSQMLNQAMASREGAGCFHRQLVDLFYAPLTPAMEEIVLTYLDDPDLEVSIGAAQIVGKFGSADTEAKLWQRLAKWRREAEGHEAEIQDPRKQGVTVSLGALELELMDALATSPAWLADRESLSQLKKSCLAPRSCERVERWLSAFDTMIGLSPFDGFSVAQYSGLSKEKLKRKLIQFPAGTSFQWAEENDTSPAEATSFYEFKTYLESHGMKLTR